MQILNIVPLENGAHENHTYHGILPEGWAIIPDDMELENFPFGDVEVEEMEVEGIGLVPIVTKWVPGVIPEPEPDIEALKAEKETEISNTAHAAIVDGVDVTLPDGSTGHFSLEETDQINLTTAYNAVLQGAVGYPYHADGQLCKVYPAADILAISEAATAHKLYHTTYCNHVLAWVRRTEDPAELETIVYGAELPEDLAANMAEVMTNAAMV